MSPTFVFVHGSNSNAFGWAPLQRELALLGHRTLAVDLPGHGFAATFPVAYQAPQDPEKFAVEPSALAGLTPAQSVEHVIDIVRRVTEHGPVILVGHSRGGLTITGAADAVPDLIDRIVYVSAWCCVTKTPAEYVQTPENASSALNETAGVVAADPAALGALRMNWGTADPELLAALKTALLADGTTSEFLAFLNTLEPDEILDTTTTPVRAEAWGRVPRTYLRLTQDRSIPVALQDLFIHDADAFTSNNPFDVRSLECGHAGFLVRPTEVAAILAGLAQTAAFSHARPAGNRSRTPRTQNSHAPSGELARVERGTRGTGTGMGVA
ncbi:MAG TPA: alpha/beta fold hydrolase [Amycolatopsis sp.]|uniref:alpha/beta fold hydrolase n=1 Tax=Amycolatopsis sp. TaxID=37632 RepID=UPI002B4A9A93|nr:alpha/beta fold hydrolase [Amycolatopsis sp.]HKS44344.1 alpha/beta fold hydrolase [Amycolatopsis sp.]